MKITFLSAFPNMSGGMKVIAIYAKKLQERGHEVEVVCNAPSPPSLKARVKGLMKLKWLPTPSRISHSHFELNGITPRIIDRHRPIEDRDLPDADVVVATWWETAEWMHNLSPQKGAKVNFIQGWEEYPVFGNRVAETRRKPAHTIVISNWLKDLFIKKYKTGHIYLIKNSVSTSQFHAPQRVKNPVPTIGFLNHNSPLKNVSLTTKAINNCFGQIGNLRPVSFGHIPLQQSPNIPPNTTYHEAPEQSSIKDIYSQCDVWVSSSNSEGFALPLLEAMACRCPVVSTRSGGPDDFVIDGKNGFLVNCGDEAALTDRILKVLSMSDSEWKAMSDAAYETATSYTWDDATDLFEKALIEAANSRKS